MSECTQVSDPGTQRIASSCRALTNVNWKGCMGVTDTTITSFFVNPITNEPHATLPSLRYLNVGLCNKISDTSTFQLSRLIQGNSKPTSNVGLHTLKFSGCFNVSDASLDSLRTMILESSCNTTTTTATAIPTGSLRLLCFSGCYKITTPAITALTTLLPHLESINLYSCPQVTNEAIISISKTCPRLLSLVISKCPLGDGAAVSLGEGCPRLHTLYMSFLTGSASGGGGGGGGGGLTDVGVKAILRGCRELKLLDLSRCDGVTDDGFFLAVENQCYLDGDCRMDIDDDDDNGDDGDDLADKSERAGNLGLQVLIVRACPRLTFEGMSRFVGKCPRLLTLDVLGCAGFGVRERERMKELVERGTG
ncbi:hypothetical protein BDR26DRAFT_861214 [Obelidium mucronatum]|nr:hypothetical protein BDR26DRAFT_861214 [Obelidium mucronatum]